MYVKLTIQEKLKDERTKRHMTLPQLAGQQAYQSPHLTDTKKMTVQI